MVDVCSLFAGLRTFSKWGLALLFLVEMRGNGNEHIARISGSLHTLQGRPSRLNSLFLALLWAPSVP